MGGGGGCLPNVEECEPRPSVTSNWTRVPRGFSSDKLLQVQSAKKRNDIKNQSESLKYYRTKSPFGTIFNMAPSSEPVDVEISKFTQILMNYSPKQCGNTPFYMTKY